MPRSGTRTWFAPARRWKTTLKVKSKFVLSLVELALAFQVCGCVLGSKDAAKTGNNELLTDGFWVATDSTWNPNCAMELKFYPNGRFDMREYQCTPDSNFPYSQTVGNYRLLGDSIHFVADTSAERNSNLFHFQWSYTCEKWDFSWHYQKVNGSSDTLETSLDGSVPLVFNRKNQADFSISNSISPETNFTRSKIQISPSMRRLCPPGNAPLAKTADCSGPIFGDFDYLYSIYDDNGYLRFTSKVVYSDLGRMGPEQIVWPSEDLNGNSIGPGYYFVQVLSRETGTLQTQCLYRQ
jgi:hypothetical protein